MNTTHHELHRAEAEIHRAAHSQDLPQVSHRAKLDREAENHRIHLNRTKHGENRIETEL
ncbi:MAG: hypothetical protein ABR907_01960 [Terracidiphilus sp.]|jgi:hypothetical protein